MHHLYLYDGICQRELERRGVNFVKRGNKKDSGNERQPVPLPGLRVWPRRVEPRQSRPISRSVQSFSDHKSSHIHPQSNRVSEENRFRFNLDMKIRPVSQRCAHGAEGRQPARTHAMRAASKVCRLRSYAPRRDICNLHPPCEHP